MNGYKARQVLKMFLLGILSLLFLQGCIENNFKVVKYAYSFENNMQGWTSNGIDLDNPPIIWKINRSNQIAYSGNYFVRLYLDNMNDAGKIWIEKEFNVSKNTNYNITISYKFATSDYGDFNLFTIITGISYNSPSTIDDLTFQGDTGYPGEERNGFTWLNKTYNFTTNTNQNDKIFVSIGIWGTWETLRLYFIDDIQILFKTC